MVFKFLTSKKFLILLGVVVIGFILSKFIHKGDSSAVNDAVLPQSQNETINTLPVKAVIKEPAFAKIPVKKIDLETSDQEDAAIQEQLDHDREAQKQTKYLKTKLEQTNLELEQEKALAEINKLKMDNIGAFKDPTEESQKNLPEIKVEYIGGGATKKEAILSIAGTNYQVKPKSNLTDSIQVMSISDSSVTLHFTAPQDLTKTIDYKPE
jgi:hypothetical protein